MSNHLVVLPFNNHRNASTVSFTGRVPVHKVSVPTFKNPIPTPKQLGPFGEFSQMPLEFVKEIESKAHVAGVSTAEYLMSRLKFTPKKSKVQAVDSKSARIGNVKVSTHIDGEQYFVKAMEFLQSAKKSIQVEMFEFQNLSVDGDKWATNGAETLDAAKLQQKMLWTLLKKKKENPDMKIQVILDAHKWYIDSYGRKRHYGNQDMLKFLKKNGIDVVPYPRASQQGSALQHIKLLVVDGKKAILGGMNWGTHSAANHDACVALETINSRKPSEIDNLITEHFNPDWKFSWQRLGETDLVAGPLTEEQQKLYNGLDKEIKKENVEYYKLLKDYFDTPEAKNRYREGRLDLTEVKRYPKSAIKVLGTKPRELSEVGEKGVETTRNYLMEKIKTCNKIRAELFVLTDKELTKTIIERFKKGELDAKFIIEADIKEKFPYCQNAFDELVENGVPVRVYKVDKSMNQRMHAKWAVFDDKEVMIGSTNWSAQGLNQNLGVGKRGDSPLTTMEIDNRILDSFSKVREHEEKLQFPRLNWSGSDLDYDELKKRLSVLQKSYRKLQKSSDTTFKMGDDVYSLNKEAFSVNVNGQDFPFSDKEKGVMAEIRTIIGYYNIIKRRHHSKETFKRGNNELAIAFESPSLAKNVFVKQFNRDWDYSVSKFESIKGKIIPIKTAVNLDKKG